MTRRSWSSDNVFQCRWCKTYQHKQNGIERQFCPKCRDFTFVEIPPSPQQIGARKHAKLTSDKAKALAMLCVQRYMRKDMTLPSASCMVRMLWEDSRDVLSKQSLIRVLRELGYEQMTGKTRAGNGWVLKRSDGNGE